jgi:vacuolar-type H+-ATPase subunit E/Vma4
VALSEVLDALRAEAAARREEEIARADAEAERIRAESRAAWDRRKIAQVERAIGAAEEAARRALSEARSESAASVLEARERLLERVRVALVERLSAAIDNPTYVATMTDELEAALARLPSGEVIVRTRPELAGMLAQQARGRARVVFEADPDMGVGFVALSPESGVEIDGTLETMLAHRWPEIAVSVSAEVAS